MNNQNLPDNPDVVVQKANKTGLFTNYIYKAIPLAFDESMSYYETLCGLLNYLKNTVIPAVNNNADAVIELQNLYTQLHDYVEHYFDNLDVQEEINNKLDEMAESGQLTDIIAQYLGLAGMITFNNVAEMKLAENLVNGSKCATLGFYNVNDNGNAFYKVRYVTNDDVIDEKTIIALYDDLLIAELIYQNEMNVECFGAKGDGETDDSSAIQTAINSPISTVLFNEKTYLLNNNINLATHEYRGNNTIIEIANATSREHFIRNINYGDTTKNDNITINGINFISDIGVSIIGLHSATLLMNNCKLNATTTSTHCLLDLYGNNKNCEISNTNFKINVSSSTERGTCLQIRGFIGGSSENIKISNCKFEQNSLDETIWINAGLCSIENVLFDNCIIKDTGNSSNSIWVSNSYKTDTPLGIKNVEFRKCDISKSTLHDRLLTIGKRQDSTDYTYINVKNIIFDNCNINVDERLTTASSSGVNILNYSKSDITYYEMIVKNCVINYNGENAINSVLNGKIISENNVFNCLKASTLFLGIYKSTNDLVKSCSSVARDCYKIKNIEVLSCVNMFYESNQYTTSTTSYLENSIVNGSYIIANQNAVTDRTFYIDNNKLTYANFLYNNYSGNTTNKVYLSNNLLSSGQNIINNASCTLYDENNYTSTGLLKGIFGNSFTLGSMPVGTTRFSNTATKSIVRKTSEGNTSANWEEV